MQLAGLDLGSQLSGWCVGDGASVPVADAWVYTQVEDDLGALGAALWADLDRLHRRFGLGVVLYEAPILVPGDKLLKLRKLYGMGVIVETWGKQNGVRVEEASVRALKKALAGYSGADKDAMVWAAEKMGVKLPDQINRGRRDAADAVAAWLIAIRYHAKHHQTRWDRVLYSARGALL